MFGNKYHNKKITTDEGKFDSKYEYEIWCRLKLLEKANKISQLQRQVPFDLIPTIKTSIQTLVKIKYYADFVYFDNELDHWCALDAKGFRTDIFQLKKRLFLLNYGDKYLFIEISKGKKDKVYKIS